MEKQPLSVSEQISPEDWENTPTNVKHLVESLVANVSLTVSENSLIKFLDFQVGLNKLPPTISIKI